MADSEAKKKWIRENSKVLSIKMMLKSDHDILEYLDGVPKATTIKAAMREYMAKYPKESEIIFK